MSAAFDRITDALRAHGSTVRMSGSRATANCPGPMHANGDKNPSLSLARIEQQALIHCHAGCSTADVLGELGMSARDLFDNPRGSEYRYRDAAGLTVLRSVYRTPDKRFRQQVAPGAPVTLYRLEDVAAAREAGEVIWLCEGEKDVDALRSLGVCAVSAPMGAANVGKCDLSPLHGCEVFAVPDADAAGEGEWAPTVSAALAGKSALTWLRPKVGKDPAEHIGAGYGLDEFEPIAPPAKPPQDAQNAAVEPRSTWEPVDLSETVAAILAGTYTRPEPTIGRLSDGRAMFYPGRVNAVIGDSTAGKTWTALETARQELEAGRGVVYIDFEDDAGGILTRLHDMGADIAEIEPRLGYVRPEGEAWGLPAREAIGRTVERLNPSVAVIDSTGEALAAQSLNPNADQEVAAWFAAVPRWIANQGPAVIVVDHLTKASNGEGRYSSGSGRKLNAITGASYTQTNKVSFSREKAGHSAIVCGKDRCGTYAVGEHVADLRITPARGPVVVELAAAAARDAASPWEPSGYMERVSLALEAAGEPLTYRGIESRVGGKKQHVRAAVDALIHRGDVTTASGPRNATLHTIANPYRERGDSQPPESAPLGVSTVPVPKEGGRGDSERTVPGGQSGDSRGTVDGEPNTDCAVCSRPLASGDHAHTFGGAR